jgi:flagellar hook-basal body complex protein FliE
MQVEPLVPDVAIPVAAASSPAGTFAALVDAAGDALNAADSAERAFTARSGGLQEMIVERARADVALQIAAGGAQRVAQSLQTLLGMQI